jgi:hypothetical protein
MPTGNFRVVACGMTGGGQTFSVSGMAVDALKYYASIANPSADYEARLAVAITRLHESEGAGLSDWEREEERRAAKSARESSKTAAGSGGA